MTINNSNNDNEIILIILNEIIMNENDNDINENNE